MRAAQGFTLFYNRKGITKTAGITDIFCFTGNWFLWQVGAMAEGGAMNMVTGQTLNANIPQQGRKWKQLCRFPRKTSLMCWGCRNVIRFISRDSQYTS
jgi:hypothetical protein